MAQPIPCAVRGAFNSLEEVSRERVCLRKERVIEPQTIAVPSPLTSFRASGPFDV